MYRMENSKVQRYSQQYANQMVRFNLYAIRKAGLIQSQTLLNVEDYMLICAPFQLSMHRAVLLVILSAQDAVFFRQFRNKLGKISFTFAKNGNRDQVNFFVRAKLDRIPEAQVAADFLAASLQVAAEVEEITFFDRLALRTREHVTLVVISLLAAILVAVPLGVLSAQLPRLGQIILGATGIVQTIPALALLVFMIPALGLGTPPAIAALFLYSLLPIVRNTYTGLHDIPLGLRESAEALGLPASVRLRRIEMPMASRAILAGIKTSAVITVGFATLAAFIGAGGYGQPIMTGIRLDNTALILEGAVPAAVLALVVQGLFELSERLFVPRGLRLQPVE